MIGRIIFRYLHVRIRKLIQAFRSFGKKVAQGETLETMYDILKYYPKGLNDDIITPDGVQLKLTGLHPVTIGRYRAGDTEKEEQALIRSLPKNKPIVEIGSGVGYITTLMNRRTNKTHIALEPNPTIFPLLSKTKELNDATFEPVHAAYHPSDKKVEFPTTKFFKTVTYDRSIENTTRISAMSLGEIIEEFELSGFHLHVDIEGSEELLLKEEMDILSHNCSSFSLEFHRRRVNNDVKLLNTLLEHFDESDRYGPPEVPVLQLRNTSL